MYTLLKVSTQSNVFHSGIFISMPLKLIHVHPSPTLPSLLLPDVSIRLLPALKEYAELPSFHISLPLSALFLSPVCLA